MEPENHKTHTNDSHRHHSNLGAPIDTKQMNSSWGQRVSFVLVAAVICFGAGFGGSMLAVKEQSGQGITQFSGSNKSDGNAIQSASEQTIASVVEKTSPSVVSIITTVGRAGQAAGTGMIVSADGYILTNKHVVEDATSASVVTSSGTIYKDVKIVGSDPLNDIAFLKISGVKDLPSITLGDSKTVRTGQTVIAIGNALGQYQNTVTSGIISGLGRPVVASSGEGGYNQQSSSESLTDLLQTDAAINSGNSGGPLLNSQGQVIGINTAVAEDAQSIGFAIPIGAAKGMLAHLLQTGKLERAIVGVQYVSITPEVKAEYDLSVDQGDYVISENGGAVRSGGPADQAGVKEKDIITKVNDQQIGPGKSISTLVGEFQPGDKVVLTLLRDGKTITTTVTLGTY